MEGWPLGSAHGTAPKPLTAAALWRLRQGRQQSCTKLVVLQAELGQIPAKIQSSQVLPLFWQEFDPA
jgi:hypothetical protein